jgi:octaprenyl-diphosphate synthase
MTTTSASDAKRSLATPTDQTTSESAEQGSAKDMARVLARITAPLEGVEAAMRQQLAGETEIMVSLGEHVISSGGKRVRPALVILAGETCQYTGPRSIQLGAALELVHTATLLHDDVVDLSDLRRGRASANAIWGNRRAILAGDFFYARACSMIVEDGDLGVLEVFADTIRLMAEGELLQLERSFDSDIGEDHYYKVIERKSAKLLSAACEIGAVVAGVSKEDQIRMASFGNELGLAFQLRDDALDYLAVEESLGKPRYADLREGKVTLPLLFTLDRCTNSEAEHIVGVLKGARDLTLRAGFEDIAEQTASLDIERALSVIERYRGVEDTVARAEEHVGRAREAITSFPDSPAKSALISAAVYAATRDH